MVKDKAYYENWNEEHCRLKRQVDYHVRMAECSKVIHQLTKNRGGLYRLLNGWAEKQNKKHCYIGTKLAIEEMVKCAEEIDYLEKYVAEKEES